jgi:ribonucleoside-diphosphate reductase alpha chain
MQAAIQQNTDNAVSKTVNLLSSATVEDVDKVYRTAHELGCKGITVYRDGSRAGQTLSSAKPFETQMGSKDGPRPRCRVTSGSTYKSHTSCGTLFVTANRDDKGLCEVFANANKGGCPSQSEATCRAISAALRCGVNPKVMIEQLRGIRCLSTCVARKDRKEIDVLSCPDAIAKALEEALDGTSAAEGPKAPVGGPTCPKCKRPLIREAACWRCVCGESDCDPALLFSMARER